jgi:hypothetical protein
VEHIKEVNDLLHRVRGPGLLPISKRRIGDKDLFRGFDKDELIVKGYPADFIIWKDIPKKIRLLDIQKGKLPFGGLVLKYLLLFSYSHLFLLVTKIKFSPNNSENLLLTLLPPSLPLSLVGRGEG